MQVRISTTNSKLGYQIPSISLPPELSCRKDAPCAHGCYGKKGNFLFSAVQNAHKQNYDCYVNDPDGYFNDIISYLNDGLVSYRAFRWHTVGDIVDYNYFLGMIRVAKKCKNTNFLCFTKNSQL